MALIKKKITKKYFDLVQSGKKKFELRLADFNAEEGDILILEEWVPDIGDRKPTGRTIEKKITYMTHVDLKKWFSTQKEIEEKGFYIIQFE